MIQVPPHPAFGHLLPLEETGEGKPIGLLLRLFAGEGARRADEGLHGRFSRTGNKT
jgi:hypothetical protein